MGIKFEFTRSEKAIIEVALELLVNEHHEDNCAFTALNARRLLKLVRSRDPQTAPGTLQTAPGTPARKLCHNCERPAVPGMYGGLYCTPNGCEKHAPSSNER